jgi:hypothetical protein
MVESALLEEQTGTEVSQAGIATLVCDPRCFLK